MDTDKQFQNTVCDKHKTCLVMDMSLIEDIACQTHSKYSLIRKCVRTIKYSTSGTGTFAKTCSWMDQIGKELDSAHTVARFIRESGL